MVELTGSSDFLVMGHVEKRVTTVNFWVCSLITE